MPYLLIIILAFSLAHSTQAQENSLTTKNQTYSCKVEGVPITISPPERVIIEHYIHIFKQGSEPYMVINFKGTSINNGYIHHSESWQNNKGVYVSLKIEDEDMKRLNFFSSYKSSNTMFPAGSFELGIKRINSTEEIQKYLTKHFFGAKPYGVYGGSVNCEETSYYATRLLPPSNWEFTSTDYEEEVTIEETETNNTNDSW
jgi:hypothetical protein